MTIVDFLGRSAAGLRIALVLFAVMLALAWCRSKRPSTPAEALRTRAWAMIAVAAMAFSPARAAYLLDHPIGRAESRFLDAIASGTACAALIAVVASFGHDRGLSHARVRRGILVNIIIAVLLALLGATWLSR